MNTKTPIHLLLRFSDSLLKGGDTIKEHNQIVKHEGEVWFGKMGATVSQNHIDILNGQVQDGIPTYIYLVKGNHQKTIAAWRKSHTCAERLGMPYELGLASLELGQHLSQGDPNREKYLVESIEIFTKLGAQYDLARAKEVRG